MHSGIYKRYFWDRHTDKHIKVAIEGFRCKNKIILPDVNKADIKMNTT